MKKTVIDELIETIEKVKTNTINKESLIMVLCYHKETHKQQIIDAYKKGSMIMGKCEEAEQYYKETYLNE